MASYTIDTVNFNTQVINSKEYKTTVDYEILNYDKNIIDDGDIHNGIYRSVIISPEDKTVLSFSLPKSIQTEEFIQMYPDNVSFSSDIVVSDYIEGTMINLFYDERIHSWEIATKTAIGGNYCYFTDTYSEHTNFKKMFIETFGYVSEEMNLNDIGELELLPKNYCYSFVLQHPNNHIVLNIEFPSLYLVAVYEIFKNSTTAVNIPLSEVKKWDIFTENEDELSSSFKNTIYFPYEYTTENDTYDRIIHFYANSVSSQYLNVGIMMTNTKTGMRTKVYNPVYSYLKDLRGNHPNLKYNYLCLCRNGRLVEFLNFFPKYNDIFHQYYDEVMNGILSLHISYCEQQVKKNKNVELLKDPFMKKHIYKIHDIYYISRLNPLFGYGRGFVSRMDVHEYFESLEIKEQYYILKKCRELIPENNLVDFE